DGVGKSTLMGIIAGAKKIQSGTVHVLGGDIAGARHRNAVCPRIAYMPQGLGKNLYFELSIYAIVPSIPPILMILIPAILMAVSVVREKELGSIINFYVTPTTRLEFLLGKQLPYIAIGMLNYVLLTLMAIVVFGVPLKG